MLRDDSEMIGLTENFNLANKKLIEFIKQGEADEQAGLAAVDAWFDAHVELARADDKYGLVFLPLYIQVLEAIRDHNPAFIRVLDQRFDEEDIFAITGGLPEENDQEADGLDERIGQIRNEIQLKSGEIRTEEKPLEEGPEEKEPTELFPTFDRLSQIGREVGDMKARASLTQSIAISGPNSPESLSFSAQYIQSVIASAVADTERIIDQELKQSAQLREKYLPQVAMIVAMLDSYFSVLDSSKFEEPVKQNLIKEIDKEIRDLIYELQDQIRQELENPGLVAARDYFLTIGEAAAKIPIPEEEQGEEGQR